MAEYKQAIIVRKDLGISTGKLCSQVAHASVEASLKSQKYNKEIFQQWRQAGMKKVILKVTSEKDLFDFKEKSERAGLISALIQDAGYTELKPGTHTCLAIGPDEEDKIDKITGDLKSL